jgi:hypothetical protein
MAWLPQRAPCSALAHYVLAREDGFPKPIYETFSCISDPVVQREPFLLIIFNGVKFPYRDNQVIHLPCLHFHVELKLSHGRSRYKQTVTLYRENASALAG